MSQTADPLNKWGDPVGTVYAGGNPDFYARQRMADENKPDQAPTEAPVIAPNPTNARDGLIDDLSAVALAIAEGRPVDTRQALVGVVGAAGGAMVGAALVRAVGVKGGVLGAVGAVLGALALDVALIKWGQRSPGVAP